jgi:hypothetical protein
LIYTSQYKVFNYYIYCLRICPQYNINWFVIINIIDYRKQVVTLYLIVLTCNDIWTYFYSEPNDRTQLIQTGVFLRNSICSRNALLIFIARNLCDTEPLAPNSHNWEHFNYARPFDCGLQAYTDIHSCIY